MLLVCEDEVGRNFFRAAPTSDLLLCREGVRLLSSHWAADSAKEARPDAARWLQLARRFLELLEDEPGRLHYDHVDTAEAAGGGWVFTIHHAWIPRRYRKALTVVWDREKLSLALAPGEEPSLTKWPVNAQNEPLAEFILDQSSAKAARRAAWGQLTALDCEWLSVIVAELPNFLHHFLEQHPGNKANVAPWLGGARSLHRELKSWSKPPSRHPLLRLFGC
jgi:hypothetical protein